MALIGTLRNKMGTWVIVIIFLAIAAFTLNDLLGRNGSFLLGEDSNVGEIAGHDISQEEYQAALQEQEVQFQLRTNRAPSESDNAVIQQQAWESLVAKNAIQPQYEELGLQVTSEEVEDMLWGKNITEGILSVPGFQNEAGEFDKNKVIQYLQYLKDAPPGQAGYQWQEERMRWEFFQKDLAPARLRLKYENLLIKTSYVTAAESEREYHAQNDVAEVKYVSVPYHAIPDSTINVTEADYEQFYQKNKERYKTDHTVDFDYVTFPVIASESDSAEVRTEMKKIAENFKLATNDSLFSLSNSGSDPNAYKRYTPNTLPPFIPKDSLVEGKVFGPVLDGSNYVVVKISRIPKNDTTYTARARHILIGWSDSTQSAKLEAKVRAEALLKQLKEGTADFAMTARQESIDTQSGQNGGDLGWFETWQMVKPFKNAVMNATKTGLVDHVVETQYGYHIIDVTNLKDNTGYWIAILQSEIRPSDETIHEAQMKADLFQSEISGVEAFNKKAEEQGLNVLSDNATPADRRVGAYNARQVIQWLFKDSKVGDVSPVFDVNYEQFIVAVKKEEIEKGYSPLSKVKDDITPALKNELKGKELVKKLSELNGSLDEIASAFGSDANVYTNNNVKFNSTSLASLGNDPIILGTIFSLDNGQRSKPTAGDNGVAVIELESKTTAPSIADYSLYKNQLQQSLSNRITYRIAEVLKEKADIADMRFKYH